MVRVKQLAMLLLQLSKSGGLKVWLMPCALIPLLPILADEVELVVWQRSDLARICCIWHADIMCMKLWPETCSNTALVHHRGLTLAYSAFYWLSATIEASLRQQMMIQSALKSL